MAPAQSEYRQIADEEGFAEQTPKRERVWQIQTPQSFSYKLILEAYQQIMREKPKGITDDAMVVEYGNYARVRLVMGSYQNIKITTPEDLVIAEAFLNSAKL